MLDHPLQHLDFPQAAFRHLRGPLRLNRVGQQRATEYWQHRSRRAQQPLLLGQLSPEKAQSRHSPGQVYPVADSRQQPHHLLQQHFVGGHLLHGLGHVVQVGR
jgi:hypothetical protein